MKQVLGGLVALCGVTSMFIALYTLVFLANLKSGSNDGNLAKAFFEAFCGLIAVGIGYGIYYSKSN